MIIDLWVVRTDDTLAQGEIHGIIQHGPAGIAIVSSTSTETLDIYAPQAFFVEWAPASNIMSAVGANEVAHVFIDTKLMRKLKELDTIFMRQISSTNITHFVSGNITLWFKE